MALDKITRRLGSSSSRRTIVKTGAKIAYATPVVAASFKLSAMGAAAQVSSSGCANGTTCIGAIVTCPGVNCYCFTTTEGTTACGNGGICPGVDQCTTSADCDAGFFCSAFDSTACCGDLRVCVARCGAAAAGATEGGLAYP